jgi:hypothetical protein
MGSKRGKGWSNEEHKEQRRKGGEEYEQKQNVREYERQQRKPYDPSLEKVVGLVGRVALNRDGTAHVYVELSSYDGGPPRISLVKRGTGQNGNDYSTPNIGKLWPRQGKELGELIALGSKQLEEESAKQRA